jgi:hypothetical protein
MTGSFITRWATVFILGDGRMRVNSDGILDCGDWTRDDLGQAIERLKEQGWVLVGSVDRRAGCDAVDGLDLFFRLKKVSE